MLDYTLKRRSVRNNCLWKARRGSEVPTEVIWYFIIVLFPLITSRNNCVRFGDKRAGGARDTSSPADKYCPLTIHIKSDGEREKESIIILTARIILKAEPFQVQNPFISTAAAKKQEKHSERTPAVLTGKTWERWMVELVIWQWLKITVKDKAEITRWFLKPVTVQCFFVKSLTNIPAEKTTLTSEKWPKHL